MAQPASNAKIEELRFKLKTDAKSRLFYPLAEELRKVGQYAEAEGVLRTGLTNHPTYLSAWVSLGRVCRELKKEREAVEALNKALQLDPGNVVAARILADAYLALGEKVEAIKKYKLVRAQMPADEQLEETIQRLDQEINPPAAATPAAPPATTPPSTPLAASPPTPPPPPPLAPAPPSFESISGASPEPGFGATSEQAAARDQRKEGEEAVETADTEPMRARHDESPFEEPAAAGYGSDAFAVEEPAGMHISQAPLAAELPASVGDEDEERPGGIAPGFITESFTANVPPPPPADDDFARTITMADLYAGQGLIDEARDIYEDILMRDPSNERVREKLAALEGSRQQEPAPLQSPFSDVEEPEPEREPVQSFTGRDSSHAAAAPKNAKVERLEQWLAKVGRKEGSGA